MLLKVVCVRDRAVQASKQPVFVAHVGGAQRAFSDAANSKEGEIGAHPDDFELYELGEYNDETMEFTMLDKPRLVCVAKDLVRG